MSQPQLGSRKLPASLTEQLSQLSTADSEQLPESPQFGPRTGARLPQSPPELCLSQSAQMEVPKNAKTLAESLPAFSPKTVVNEAAVYRPKQSLKTPRLSSSPQSISRRLTELQQNVTVGSPRRGSLRSIHFAKKFDPDGPNAESVGQLALFCQAIKLGLARKVNEMLNSNKELVNMRNYDGRTALHLACAEGQFDIVKMLVRAGALVSIRDRFDYTPFEDALMRKVENQEAHNELLQFLRSVKEQAAPAPDAAENGGGEDQLKTLMMGINDPMILADDAGKIEMVNNTCATMFRYAAEELIGHNMSMLFTRESYANVWAESGRQTGNNSCKVTGLTKQGAELTVTLRLSAIDTEAGSKIVVNLHDASQMGTDKLSLDLCDAAGTGDLPKLKDLLKKEGVRINQGNYDKRTPLHIAASTGQYHAVKFLLQSGAHVNPIDRWGRTPLACVLETRGIDHPISKLLITLRAMVYEDSLLISAEESRVVCGDSAWEINPRDIHVQMLKKLGKGSFGEVYMGTWRGTNVAVKRLVTKPEDDLSLALAEFTVEVTVMRKVSHPSICQFFGAWLKHSPYLMVCEYMAGGSIADLITKRNGKPFRHATVLKWIRQMAAGMEYLHSLVPPIIHRDLKPGNLLVDAKGDLKIADFGLAKVKRMDIVKGTYQMTGQTGSYRYMAPEVYAGADQYTEKVDQHSFGIICFELLEGCKYLSGVPPIEIAKKTLKGGRPLFTKPMPTGLPELAAACWHPDAAQRPSFKDIGVALDAIHNQKDIPKECIIA